MNKTNTNTKAKSVDVCMRMERVKGDMVTAGGRVGVLEYGVMRYELTFPMCEVDVNCWRMAVLFGRRVWGTVEVERTGGGEAAIRGGGILQMLEGDCRRELSQMGMIFSLEVSA